MIISDIYIYIQSNKQIMHPIITLFHISLLLCFLELSTAITVIHQKKNVLVPQNAAYMFQVGLEKQNADLIPSYVDIEYDIYNYNGTSCNYFDFFYYVSESDIQCYNYAIGNQSYLFPCPFLSNNYAIIRTNKISGLSQMPKLQINKIQTLNYMYIIDNTKFPFPSGAYPYTDININIKTTLSIQVSSLYQQLALRLIAINATILAIFLFIITVLIVKERKIRKQIQGERKESLRANLILDEDEKKQHIHQQLDSEAEQEGHYEDFIGKNISPSLLQSKERTIVLDYSGGNDY